jgi:hypothetical protein
MIRCDDCLNEFANATEFFEHTCPRRHFFSLEPGSVAMSGHLTPDGGHEARRALALGPGPEAPPADDRKRFPVATGCFDYFPDALKAVSECSRIANEQHNPGEPMRWNRAKSADEANTLARHFLERGTRDTDNVRHSTKVAWRALALLQKEIEADGGEI